MNDVARRLATAASRAELGRTIEEYLREAFEPRSLVVYLQHGDGTLRVNSAPAISHLTLMVARVR